MTSLEKVEGVIGKFRNPATGQIYTINDWWEADLLTQRFMIPVDQISPVVLQGRAPSEFVLRQLVYVLDADTRPDDKEEFKHSGRIDIFINGTRATSLPMLLMEYSAEALLEIIQAVKSGEAWAFVDESRAQVGADVWRVLQGWRLSQPLLFPKDSKWEISIGTNGRCYVEGTITGIGFAKRGFA
jgi:hypothetical protein